MPSSPLPGRPGIVIKHCLEAAVIHRIPPESWEDLHYYIVNHAAWDWDDTMILHWKQDVIDYFLDCCKKYHNDTKIATFALILKRIQEEETTEEVSMVDMDDSIAEESNQNASSSPKNITDYESVKPNRVIFNVRLNDRRIDALTATYTEAQISRICDNIVLERWSLADKTYQARYFNRPILQRMAICIDLSWELAARGGTQCTTFEVVPDDEMRSDVEFGQNMFDEPLSNTSFRGRRRVTVLQPLFSQEAPPTRSNEHERKSMSKGESESGKSAVGLTGSIYLDSHSDLALKRGNESVSEGDSESECEGHMSDNNSTGAVDLSTYRRHAPRRNRRSNRLWQIFVDTKETLGGFTSPEAGQSFDSRSKLYCCTVPQCEALRFSSRADLVRHESDTHALNIEEGQLYLCDYEDCVHAVPGNGFQHHSMFLDHLKHAHNDQRLQSSSYSGELLVGGTGASTSSSFEKSNVQEGRLPDWTSENASTNELPLDTAAIEHPNITTQNSDEKAQMKAPDPLVDVSTPEELKTVIHDLYFVQGRPLTDMRDGIKLRDTNIIDTMESLHGLKLSQEQYEQLFEKWGWTEKSNDNDNKNSTEDPGAEIMKNAIEHNSHSHGHYTEYTGTTFVATEQSIFSQAKTDADVTPQQSSAGESLESSDILSVISNSNDIDSTTSVAHTGQTRIAEESIATLLAISDGSRKFHEQALSKMDRGRIINNYRRLLKQYYLDLSVGATSSLEKATVHLLKSRRARTRIAGRILDIVRPSKGQLNLDEEESAKIQETNHFTLERWIKDTLGLAGKSQADPMPHENADSGDQEAHNDGEENSDDNDDDDVDGPSNLVFEKEGFPHVSEMQRMLIEGTPFTDLQVNIQMFLLPAAYQNLTRALMAVPNDNITFKSYCNVGMIDRAKSFVERHTDDQWDWWPLSQPQQSLSQNETRVEWVCNCGTSLSQNIPSSVAESYKILLATRGDLLRDDHLCVPNFKTRSSVSSSKLSLASETGSSSSTSIEMQSVDITSSSSHTSSTASRSMREDSDASSLSSNSTQITIPDRGPSASLGIDIETIPGLYILFGINGRRKTLDLPQIDSKVHNSDRKLFAELQSQFRQYRGFWRIWLSVWKLSHCDFVKFEKLCANRIISRGRGLPTTQEYEYVAVNDPPITQHEFKLAFEACENQKCWLSSLHDCYHISERPLAVGKIPKRRTQLEVLIDTNEYAWGLEVRLCISFIRMFSYHCFILLGPFVFWGVWQAYNPSDLQGAAVPASIFIALISLFWTTNGVLRVLREPWDG